MISFMFFVFYAVLFLYIFMLCSFIEFLKINFWVFTFFLGVYSLFLNGRVSTRYAS